MLENELNELKQLEQHANARDESRASKGSKDRGSTEDKVKGLREGVGEERQGESRGGEDEVVATGCAMEGRRGEGKVSDGGGGGVIEIDWYVEGGSSKEESRRGEV